MVVIMGRNSISKVVEVFPAVVVRISKKEQFFKMSENRLESAMVKRQLEIGDALSKIDFHRYITWPLYIAHIGRLVLWLLIGV